LTDKLEAGTHEQTVGAARYPRLLSELQLRHTRIRNHVVFAPTCPSWVSSPQKAEFNELAAAYYGERASGGVGLIIIGGTHVHESSMAAPLSQPGLWDDRQIPGFAAVADEVHKHGAKLAVQLRHTGVNGTAAYKMEPSYDPDTSYYVLAPSQVPNGEYLMGQTPKELSDAEIQEIIQAHGTAAERAIKAGLDGVEFHCAHGFLSWQFLSPVHNQRTDKWGGSHENRLRFVVECLKVMREAVGDAPFMGYRITSNSFWPNDLVIDDVKRVVADIEAQCDIDFVDVTVGVDHRFIHTPMEFEQGWEKGYTKAIKEVSNKPVFIVGRITTPEVAEQLLETGHADVVSLARQLFADPDWVIKAQAGRAEDIRRCVAANYCFKNVMGGARVQCIYNPVTGRERIWGKGTLQQASPAKKVLVIGGGPSGLEFARIASARGHQVVVLEREAEVGGHSRLHSMLPTRKEYGRVGIWLGEQAARNGSDVRTSSPVTAENLADVLAAERPDHVVVATGSRVARDGFQGWTGAPLPGHETANVVGWDEVATGRVTPSGDVLVIDDQNDVLGPLTAVSIAESGRAHSVKIVTRWPALGLELMRDSYLEWIFPRIYKAGVQMIPDRFVRLIDANSVTLYNLHNPEDLMEVNADWIVTATARLSENWLEPLVRELGYSVEVIGDAVAPRGTFEAVFEGHRQGRKV
jgi:2,4-dienoyl-CoA reductase-like NADH-dependent reductase (Old Yellow Enzyme family)